VLRNRRGQALVDYTLLLLVAAALVALFIFTMRSQVVAVLHSTASALQIGS
jgi:hypothetical protein